MATKSLEDVVGAPVLADASVMTGNARARMKAAQLGPPLSALATKLSSRRQARAAKKGNDLGPSSGPESCTLAVTDTELVAVQTKPGFNSLQAVSVLERIPRTSVLSAHIEPANPLSRASMVIAFSNGSQWVFEVLGGVPRKRCEQVITALGI